MNKLEDDVKTALLEVGILQAEYRQLTKEGNELEKRLAAIKTRLRSISGWAGDGLLKNANRKLSDAKLALSDSTKRTVIFVNESKAKRHVVTKVTKKRVYIREVGCTRETYRDKVTGNGSSRYDNPIYLEGTFPEGVDSYEG